MSGPAALVGAIALVALGGLFSALDAAIGTVSIARVSEMVREERPGAVRLSAVIAERPRYVSLVVLLRIVCETTATVLLVAYLSAHMSLGWALVVAAAIMVVTSFVLIGVGPRTVGRQNAYSISLMSAAVLQAISVLLISPLSGIPGVPTVSAALIVLIGAQGLMRRRHLWLPEVLMRREIAAARIEKGVAWLRRPCAWIDRHARPRLCALTAGPMRPLAVLICLLIASSWPLLEILPMVTSLGATAIALIVFGLLTRDGLFALLGYGAVAGLAALIWWLA